MAASLSVINIMTCYKLNWNVSYQTEVLLNLNTNLAIEKLDWTAVEKKGISKLRQRNSVNQTTTNLVKVWKACRQLLKYWKRSDNSK